MRDGKVFTKLEERNITTCVALNNSLFTYKFSSDDELRKFLNGEECVDSNGTAHKGGIVQSPEQICRVWKEAELSPVYIKSDLISRRDEELKAFLALDSDIESTGSGSGKYVTQVISQDNDTGYSDYHIKTMWVDEDMGSQLVTRWNVRYRVMDDGNILVGRTAFDGKLEYGSVFEFYLERVFQNALLSDTYEYPKEYYDYAVKFKDFLDTYVEMPKCYYPNTVQDREPIELEER